MSEPDCDFLYFKPGGKWKYEGEGVFPHREGYYEVTRELIMEDNDGMPGISGTADEFVVIVIPRPNCTSRFAFPRMLKEIA